jgi:hypothetical protein
MDNPYLIHPATIVEKVREADDIHTYRLRLNDEQARRHYRFAAGQFNMVYLFGVGEVAISIVSDPDEPEWLDHTIRTAGRVTSAIAQLQVGEALGIRGPTASTIWIRQDSPRRQDTARSAVSRAVRRVAEASRYRGVADERPAGQNMGASCRRSDRTIRARVDRRGEDDGDDVRARDHDAHGCADSSSPRDSRDRRLCVAGAAYGMRHRPLRPLPDGALFSVQRRVGHAL